VGVGFPFGAAGSSPHRLVETMPNAAEAARASIQDRETHLGNIFHLP
jgi:hypothetical protein